MRTLPKGPPSIFEAAISPSEHTKYPKYEPEVNAVLDVARAAVRLTRYFEDATPADVIQHLTDFAGEWSWSLIDIIMDYEQRDDRRATLIRNFRRLHPRRKR